MIGNAITDAANLEQALLIEEEYATLKDEGIFSQYEQDNLIAKWYGGVSFGLLFDLECGQFDGVGYVFS